MSSYVRNCGRDLQAVSSFPEEMGLSFISFYLFYILSYFCLYPSHLLSPPRRPRSHPPDKTRQKCQEQVQDPVLVFDGEAADDDDVEEEPEPEPDSGGAGGDDGGGGGKEEGGGTFLRSVAITMGCPTRNATLRYTTDGMSYPGDMSPSVPPGTLLQWSEEGTTEFRVVAVADGMYPSELTKWPVTIVAPRTDEYPVAGSSEGEAGRERGKD